MSDVSDSVVAGGGVSGMTAAWHLARLGRRVTLITGGIPGGHLLGVERIEGLPGFTEGVPGFDFCPMLQEQAESAGVVCVGAEFAGFKRDGSRIRVQTTDGELEALALVVATGTELKRLDIPGEERLRGRGVSHCAGCDAPLLRGLIAAVVGGGDSAMQESLTLADAGVRVILLQRGPALTGKAEFQKRVAAHPLVDIRLDVVVDEIIGSDRVTGLAVRDLATGEDERIDVAGVFVSVGLTPNVGLVASTLDRDSGDAILTDELLQTSQAGVFAAGTVRSGSAGQAAHAIGDGALAAVGVDRFLSGRSG